MGTEEEGYKGSGGGEETESAGVRQTSNSSSISDCLNVALNMTGCKYSLS